MLPNLKVIKQWNDKSQKNCRVVKKEQQVFSESLRRFPIWEGHEFHCKNFHHSIWRNVVALHLLVWKGWDGHGTRFQTDEIYYSFWQVHFFCFGPQGDICYWEVLKSSGTASNSTSGLLLHRSDPFPWQHYSQWPKGGKNPSILQWIKSKQNVPSIDSGIVFSLKKGRNSDT